MTGDVADETQHLCDSASLPNHPSFSTPYGISGSCASVVEPKIKTSLVHQEPGVGVNSSPAQLQGLSEGIKRTHLPWEHQSYTMSVRGDESNNSASLVSSRRSGKAPGLKAVDLKSTASHSNQAKPKQAPSVSHNNKNGGSQSNGPKCQKRKKCDNLTGPPASSASLVVSPISAPTLHSNQSYYPDVLLQQIMPGVHQVVDQLETAMVVTQQVGDGPGTYNIQLMPTAPQDANQMSAMTQFSIQPGPNLQYQSAAAHIQIVLPVDAVLESSQPSDQVGSQMFSETLNFTESQLLDPTAQPVITNNRTMVAGQLTASQ
ncbi:unnamed protein product [Lymnaea stagnalis]|uniref:Uncharacterized protein n=1 Tax=Lymnaea stagnalis TaxID=6523 RepID=A0AAV2IGY7_LYMST